MERRSYRLGVAAGSVAVAALAVFALGRSSGSDGAGSPDATPRRVDAGGFCAAGTAEEVRLDRAIEVVEFGLLVPDHAAARAANLDRVLLCWNGSSDVRAVAAVRLEYGSGVVVIEEESDLADPERTYRELAEEPGISLTTVHGRVGNLGEISDERGAPGGVEWVEGGRRVVVQGNGAIDPAALLAVARSARAAT